VLIGLLQTRLGASDALVIAAASRVLLTLIDAVVAGVAFLALRRDRGKAEGPETPALTLDPPKSLTP
jgi:hypothetical protein